MHSQSPARTDQPYPLPWVVVDWGIVRSLVASDGLPGRFTAVFSDRMLSEALGSDNPATRVRNIDLILRHPNSLGRVVVGDYWHEIAARERDPRRVRAGSDGCTNAELTALVRQVQSGEASLEVAHAQVALDGYEGRKSDFVSLVKRFQEWIATNSPDQVAEGARLDDEARSRLISGHTTEFANAIQAHAPHLRGKRWRKLLAEFPDRCAYGRWIRIAAWYALRRLYAHQESDKKIGNNYDDAHYVFLAQYTRHLWTRDAGMRTAAQAVSAGHVKCYSTLGEIEAG